MAHFKRKKIRSVALWSNGRTNSYRLNIIKNAYKTLDKLISSKEI